MTLMSRTYCRAFVVALVTTPFADHRPAPLGAHMKPLRSEMAPTGCARLPLFPAGIVLCAEGLVRLEFAAVCDWPAPQAVRKSAVDSKSTADRRNDTQSPGVLLSSAPLIGCYPPVRPQQSSR